MPHKPHGCSFVKTRFCSSTGTAASSGWWGGREVPKSILTSLSLVCMSTFFSPLVKVFLKIRVEPLVIFSICFIAQIPLFLFIQMLWGCLCTSVCRKPEWICSFQIATYKLPIFTLLQLLLTCCGHRTTKTTENRLLSGTKLCLETFHPFWNSALKSVFVSDRTVMWPSPAQINSSAIEIHSACAGTSASADKQS